MSKKCILQIVFILLRIHFISRFTEAFTLNGDRFDFIEWIQTFSLDHLYIRKNRVLCKINEVYIYIWKIILMKTRCFCNILFFNMHMPYNRVILNVLWIWPCLMLKPLPLKLWSFMRQYHAMKILVLKGFFHILAFHNYFGSIWGLIMKVISKAIWPSLEIREGQIFS